MKRNFIILLFLLLTITGVFSNQITKIGVVDVSKVYTRYVRDSAGARDIDKLKADFEDEMARRKIEIDQISQDLIKARDNDNQDLVVKLESDLEIKKTNLQQFFLFKSREINTLISSDAAKTEFADKLYDVIQKVALQNGFSLILKKSDPAIYWMSQEIDITELVIQGMTN